MNRVDEYLIEAVAAPLIGLLWGNRERLKRIEKKLDERRKQQILK